MFYYKNGNKIIGYKKEEHVPQEVKINYEYIGDAILLPNTEESKHIKIAQLKSELSSYDYIGVKIAMGVATKEEYADKIAYTETLREKINKLEVSGGE